MFDIGVEQVNLVCPKQMNTESGLEAVGPHGRFTSILSDSGVLAAVPFSTTSCVPGGGLREW